MDKPAGRARRLDPTVQHRRESSQSRTSSPHHSHPPSSRTTNHNDHELGGSGSRARQSQANALPGGSAFGDVVALSRSAPGGGNKKHSLSISSASQSPRSKNEAYIRRDKSKTPPSQLSSSEMDSGSAARAAISAFTTSSSKQEDDDHKYSSATRPHNSSRQEERKSKGQDIKRNDANYEPSSRDSPILSRRSDEEARRPRHRRGSKSASNTPKTKRRERSASRPRDSTVVKGGYSPDATDVSGEGELSAELDSGKHDSGVDPSTRARRASIPVIRLSREDSKTHREIPLDDLSGPDPQKRVSSKRRMSAFCHAKLAFEKVAMAVTDTDPVVVTRKHSRDAKSGKERRSRAQSAPRELMLLDPGGRRAPSMSPASSRDNVGSDECDNADADDEMQRLHIKEKVPSPKPEKGKRKKKSQEPGRNHQRESSNEAPSSGRKSSAGAPFRFLQAITKSSSSNSSKSDGSSTHISSPPRQPTPSRPRKKFSRGHIDQDPLEVDYEILDDRVASIKPRPSLPNTHELVNRIASSSASSSRTTAVEPRRSVPDRIKKSSVEEPLLSKQSETEVKFAALRERQRDQRAQSLPRPYVSYVPSTFPRTSKQQQIQHPLQDVRVNNHGDIRQEPIDRTSIYTPTERLVSGKALGLYEDKQDFPSTELASPEKPSRPVNFSPLHKVPSKSSCTSSDAQSDVCLDLPDLGDQGDDDLHLHLRDPDLQVHQRDPKELRVKHSFPSAPYGRIAHFSQKNLLLAFFSSLLTCILSFLLMWPLLVTLLVVVPCVVLLKRLCGMFCCCAACSGAGITSLSYACCCVCCCHTHLTSSELVWLGRQGDHGPGRSRGGRTDRKSMGSSTDGQSSPAIVQSLLVLQRGLDTERIRRLVDSRLLSVENRHGQKLYPRFTQKVRDVERKDGGMKTL